MNIYGLNRNLKRRSLFVTEPYQTEWVMEDIRQPESDEVLVETLAGAISIGSELPQFTGLARQKSKPEYPLMTGYESYGRIVATGANVSEKYLGETVIGFYGHRTHAILPFAKLLFAPSRFSPPQALPVILTCDVAKGIRRLNLQPEMRVMITGAGAIGLMAVWVLRQYGVQVIHVIEPDSERRQKAIDIGARVAASPDMTYTWTPEYDIGIECSSTNRAFHLLQDKVKAKGQICILSDGNREPLSLSTEFHRKELTVFGSSDGWDYHQHAIWYWRCMDNDTLSENLFDVRVHADDLPAVFTALGAGELHAIKVLVNYHRR